MDHTGGGVTCKNVTNLSSDYKCSNSFSHSLSLDNPGFLDPALEEEVFDSNGLPLREERQLISVRTKFIFSTAGNSGIFSFQRVCTSQT